MTGGAELRALLDRDQTWFIPACFDALSALLVRQAGFDFGFISGYGIAATRLGLPDVGLATGSEMVDTIRTICGAVPGFPLIADGDQGYGTSMNVRRTTLEYARAGVAAIMLEDQISPKRCGHFGEKQVISREEARLKIRSAIDMRREYDLDILIMARTDALATHGFEEALTRVLEFEEEGADILFIEALETEEQMRTFCRSVKQITFANNFRGGRTPYLSRSTLTDIGFKVVTDPTLLFTATYAMQSHLKALATEQGEPLPLSTPFREMSEILNLPEYTKIAERYKS
jgi:2-methylisocitrate lyase-like PEP mutase family enzyme